MVVAAGRVIDFGREALVDADGQVIELRPQAYQVLRHLALNIGRLVSKEELLEAVWPQVVVTDDSLVQAIGDARRALGDTKHQVLKTVPRRGYLLTADASAAAAPEQPQRKRRWPRPAATVGGVVALMAIAAALWAGTAGRSVSPPPERPSIAVLAFKDPRSEVEGQLLARSFAEDLVSELARGSDLRVVSHQSSFQFAGGATPIAEIGRRLRSRYLVDGTIQRQGEQLRIVVELLDSEDGRVVWSSSRRVDRESLPQARNTVVGRIAGALLSKVRRTEERLRPGVGLPRHRQHGRPRLAPDG